MDIFFTHHAIDRFIQRHCPEMPRDAALCLLKQQGATATKIREKTIKGQDQWEIHDPYCILVTKYDGQAIICVTVLPEPEAKGFSEEELEWVRESATSNPHWDKLVKETQAIDRIEQKLSRIQPQLELDRQKLSQAPKEVGSIARKKQISEELARLKIWQSLHASLINCETRVQSWWAQVAFHSALNRARAHGELMDQERRKASQGLRLALQYIVNSEGSREDVLQNIKKLDPGYLTKAFLEPGIAKAERRLESKLVQQQAEDDENTPSLPHLEYDGRTQGNL